MAKTNKIDRQVNDNRIQKDIREINKIRRELGKRPMPIKNNTWYKNVVKYAQEKYPKNPEFAVKMIGSGMTPYGAEKLNKSKTYKAQLNTVVNKRNFSNSTLDQAIRAQDVTMFESYQFGEMNAVQEAMLDVGQLDVRQATRAIYETKLTGLRPR